MLEGRTLILNNLEVNQKLNRMAYQILEDIYQEEEVYMLGLQSGGYVLAEKVEKIINASNAKVKTNLVSVEVIKDNPASNEIKMEVDIETLRDKVIILFDDVANTGRVLTYAIRPLLSILPKKIRAMVLVDRRHKKYPITPDFVGLSLATTMQEHISVEVDDNQEITVFLN